MGPGYSPHYGNVVVKLLRVPLQHCSWRGDAKDHNTAGSSAHFGVFQRAASTQPGESLVAKQDIEMLWKTAGHEIKCFSLNMGAVFLYLRSCPLQADGRLQKNHANLQNAGNYCMIAS